MCEASLTRLQTDCIDVYQMHHVDRDTPWDEIWEAMETLRSQGKIIYVGSSNFAGWHIAQAQEAAKAHRVLGLVSEQSKYSLLVRAIEREVLPAAREYGLGVMAWSPLSGGALGGILAMESEGGLNGQRVPRVFLEKHRAQLEKYEELCVEVGASPAHVALAWLLSRPDVTCPIIGPVSVDQLDDAVRSRELRLDETTLERLDRIFPGYRTAPEDYAW